MQGPILIFLLIVVVSMVIGAVSQVLKVAQKAAPPPRARPRPAAARPASGEIDRFLEEIDRLRKKKAEGAADRPTSQPPVARPVKVAKVLPPTEARRPKRRPDVPPVAKPAAPPPRLADLPMATPVVEPAAFVRSEVTAQPRLAALPKVTSGPAVSASLGQQRQNRFKRDLTALLASPQATPMAVVLTEILGPPKCRKG